MRTVLLPMTAHRLWKAGALPDLDGAVHVSMNDYWVHRWRSVPLVMRAGLGFRRRWPATEGSVGLWMAVFNGSRRQVSISIWRSPEDLLRFVRSPEHLRVMRDFRDAGSLITTVWSAPSGDRQLIWRQAEDRLFGRVPDVAHH